jgi:hypothetical protein
MGTGTGISALYQEFIDALIEVLAENAGNPRTPWPTGEGTRRR